MFQVRSQVCEIDEIPRSAMLILSQRSSRRGPYPDSHEQRNSSIQIIRRYATQRIFWSFWGNGFARRWLTEGRILERTSIERDIPYALQRIYAAVNYEFEYARH